MDSQIKEFNIFSPIEKYTVYMIIGIYIWNVLDAILSYIAFTQMPFLSEENPLIIYLIKVFGSEIALSIKMVLVSVSIIFILFCYRQLVRAYNTPTPQKFVFKFIAFDSASVFP